MIYYLVNPSDVITFEADDENVLMAGVLALSARVGLDSIGGGDTIMFPFMADKATQQQWLDDRFGGDLVKFREAHANEVADAVSSILYGSPSDRNLFQLATKKMTPEETEIFRAEWNDKKRSSMNDYHKICMEAARRLREIAKLTEAERE